MEAQGTGSPEGKILSIHRDRKKAQSGDKASMEDILSLFSVDIDYLSRFIMLPREEAIQTLKIELINIVYQDL
ncbi:helix-turn-helix domain-containing protein [Paenibacillus rhizoplanae]